MIQAAPSEVLLRLLRAARGAGVRISTAESLDALAVAALVGWSDRRLLRDALGLSLAKTVEETTLFEICFDTYFARSQPAAATDADPPPETADPLSRLLLANDPAAIAVALERAGEAAGASDIRLFTQTNLFARRMLDRMGLAGLEQEIAARTEAGDPEAARLDQARAALAVDARRYMERQLTLFAATTTRETREHALRAVRLTQLDRRDIARMRVLIETLARRLATRHGRRRHRAERGRLDARRTLRRNTATGGIPFVTSWKRRRIDRPKLLVLCDVSGSVASVARFLLIFLYALTDVIAGIRSFAFSSHSVEVSDLLAKPDIEAAIGEILESIGFGSSDYGRSLAGFAEQAGRAIDRGTTLLILGDARGNRAPPRVELMQDFFMRAGRVIWLNPEPEAFWGSGDSDMLRYAPYCHQALSCNNLTQLERVIDGLLRG